MGRLSAGFGRALPPPAVRRQGGPEEFARNVERELEGSILRYSRRQRLIRDGERRGLSRFEANLVIALVEHRHKKRAKGPSHRNYSTPGWVWFIVIQLLLLCGYGAVWWS